MNDLRTDSCRWRAACLLAALSLLTACPLWAAAWPTPDFDHGRTRHNVDETGLALPLSALWSTDPAQWTVSHDPILAAGLVYSYCAPPETEVKDGSLCAFDQASGTIVWRRTVREIFGEFPAPPYAWLFLSELTWSGDRLFLVLNDKRGDRGTSFLKALDGGDGATIWSQEIDWQEIQPRDEPMLNAPIVVDGDVFVVSDIGRIFSFDAGGGSLNWSRLSDEYRGCRQSLMLQGRLLQT
ncbi:MAG: PQQ-binding-like beta-propeller repeat protein, partial [bacterium]|nr:PQQ-binding-like beta-propeller repeat protein [bacterium]